MILFLTNKSSSLADVIEFTGIRSNNFWFEYFIQLFKDSCIRFEDLQSLVNHLKADKSDVIRKLKALDIDGAFFTVGVVYLLEQSTFGVNFTKLRSRKIRVFELEL
jgi:hypothetical protein